MEDFNRSKKEKYKERVQKLARASLTKPKHYEDAKKKYPMEHFKKGKMSNIG